MPSKGNISRAFFSRGLLLCTSRDTIAPIRRPHRRSPVVKKVYCLAVRVTLLAPRLLGIRPFGRLRRRRLLGVGRFLDWHAQHLLSQSNLPIINMKIPEISSRKETFPGLFSHGDSCYFFSGPAAGADSMEKALEARMVPSAVTASTFHCPVLLGETCVLLQVRQVRPSIGSVILATSRSP